jgi:hypothetical protein
MSSPVRVAGTTFVRGGSFPLEEDEDVPAASNEVFPRRTTEAEGTEPTADVAVSNFSRTSISGHTGDG